MKSAEELAAGSAWFVHDSRVELVKKIQLDAWRQGMTDAAEIIGNDKSTSKHLTDAHAILVARDTEITL